MIRSIVVIMLATLVFSTDVSAAMNVTGTLPIGGKETKPLPPGPHFIFTVPVTLHGLPPEVNQYEVSCDVFVRGYQPSVGHGSAVGAIPDAGSKSSGVDFKTEATVGVVVTKGDMVTLGSVEKCQCRLYLRGTAYGATTNYLSDANTNVQLYATASHPLQQGEAGFPLTPGASFIRIINVDIPR